MSVRRINRTPVLTRGVVAVACVAVSIARAGPPLLTDDPETLPKGRFELNTAYTLAVSARDGDAGRTWEHEAPLFDLNYGLVEGVQLKFEVPLVAVLDEADGGSARAGLGDLSLGAKLRLLDEKERALGVSVYPAFGVPTGNHAKGLSTGSPSLTLPVQAGRHFLEDKLFVYADAGYQEQFAKGEPDLWYTGLAAEYEVSDGVVLCAEVRGEFGVRGGDDDALFNVGLKWALAEHATFIGAVGRSFDPSPESGADLLLYVGVQWSF